MTDDDDALCKNHTVINIRQERLGAAVL